LRRKEKSHNQGKSPTSNGEKEKGIKRFRLTVTPKKEEVKTVGEKGEAKTGQVLQLRRKKTAGGNRHHRKKGPGNFNSKGIVDRLWRQRARSANDSGSWT